MCVVIQPPVNTSAPFPTADSPPPTHTHSTRPHNSFLTHNFRVNTPPRPIPPPMPPHRFSELSTLIKSGAGLHGSKVSGTAAHVPGLYMYGGVGCGKTMLMDLLVAAAPKEFQVCAVVHI